MNLRQKANNIYRRIKNGKDWRQREGLVLSLEKNDNRFYTFPSAVAMPNIRQEHVFARMEEVSLGVTKPHLLAFIKTMEEKGATSNIGEIMMLVQYFKAVVEKPINVTPMLYLSVPVVILNDEPIDKPTQKHEEQKLKLQQEDEEIRGFFLNISTNILTKYSQDWTSTEIWSELMEPVSQKTEQIFLKLIGTPNSMNT